MKHFEWPNSQKTTTKLKEFKCNLKTLKEHSACILKCTFTENKFWGAIENCDKNKMLRLDSFNLNFFKKLLKIIICAIMNFIHEF